MSGAATAAGQGTSSAQKCRYCNVDSGHIKTYGNVCWDISSSGEISNGSVQGSVYRGVGPTCWFTKIKLAYSSGFIRHQTSESVCQPGLAEQRAPIGSSGGRGLRRWPPFPSRTLPCERLGSTLRN